MNVAIDIHDMATVWNSHKYIRNTRNTCTLTEILNTQRSIAYFMCDLELFFKNLVSIQ